MITGDLTKRDEKTWQHNIQKKATSKLEEDVQEEGEMVVWGLFLREKSQTKKKRRDHLGGSANILFLNFHFCLPRSSLSSLLDWRHSLPPRNSRSRGPGVLGFPHKQEDLGCKY